MAYSKDFTFTNRFGSFTGGAEGTALGSAFRARNMIAEGGPQQTFWVNVPAGSTRISAQIGNASDPAAGTWAVLVDPYSVPSGRTEYDYLDVIANPMYGSVSVTDPAALHASGSSWTANATATALVAPDAGRFLQGFVQVLSGNTVLGSAELDLMNVTP